MFRVIDDLKKFDDVRMIEFFKNSYFSLYSIVCDFILGYEYLLQLLFVHYFHSIDLPSVLVHTLGNLTKLPLTDGLNYNILID
jgi:hypothetical protein